VLGTRYWVRGVFGGLDLGDDCGVGEAFEEEGDGAFLFYDFGFWGEGA
jgi:hypothetical protein